jgi:hypothetical protein
VLGGAQFFMDKFLLTDLIGVALIGQKYVKQSEELVLC